MSAFTYTPKPNRSRMPNRKRARIGFFFSVSVAEFQQIRQVILIKFALSQPRGLFVFNFVIMKSLMDCPARKLCDYFTSKILQNTAFCGTRPRATIKTTNLRQWHGTICIVKEFLLSEREISPNCTGIFLDFVHGFGSYVKGLPKRKRCKSVAVTVSVRFRFGISVYVKRPLL